MNHQIYTYLIIYLFFIKRIKRKQMNLQSLKQYSFYYKGSKIQLTFAQGTTQTQIIETLKIVFKISESKKLLFMGDDGKLIVLSSKLPNQTKLTVIDGDYQFAGFTEFNGRQSSWIWKKPENSKFINDKSFETSGQGKLVVYGDIKMKKPGKYWWRVQINQIWCCQELGITSESLQQGFWLSKPEQYNKTIGFPSRFPGQTTGPGDTGCKQLNWKNHIFHCCLNFKDNTFKIVNETLKKTIQDAKVEETSTLMHINSLQKQADVLLNTQDERRHFLISSSIMQIGQYIKIIADVSKNSPGTQVLVDIVMFFVYVYYIDRLWQQDHVCFFFFKKHNYQINLLL